MFASSTSSSIEALHEPQVGLSLLHQPAQVLRPGRPHPQPRLLQQLPRLVEVEPFPETHGLSHSRADVIAHLRVMPGSSAARATRRRRSPAQPSQRRCQQRRGRRVAPAPAP